MVEQEKSLKVEKPPNKKPKSKNKHMIGAGVHVTASQLSAD
jgi:hypothetical protein